MTAHKENCKTTTPSVLNLGPKKLVTNGRLSTTASHVHVDLLRLLHLLHGHPHLGLLDQVLQALAAAHVQRRGGGPSLQGGLHAVAGLPLRPRPDQASPESLEGAERGLESYSIAMTMASSTCSGTSSEVGWRTLLLGAQDMREEVVEERGIMLEACLVRQFSRPPLRGEATLLNSYSHDVSIVTRLRSWVRLNE